MVLVEHGGAGGTIAWPIAKQIIEGYFTSSKIRGPAAITAPAKTASKDGK